MLTAKKSAWFDAVFRVYNRNLLARKFSALHCRNLQVLASNELPVIVYANHSSWWDGLVCHEIFKRAGSDMFVMMEEKHLRRYPLVRRLGAFSVDRENARAAFGSIVYAARLLKEKPGRSVLMFPQGKILPSRARPISFESGIGRLVERVVPCRVVPLALSYEFRDGFKPEIFARIGEAGPGFDPPEDQPDALARRLSSELDAQERFLADGSDDGYVNIL